MCSADIAHFMAVVNMTPLESVVRFTAISGKWLGPWGNRHQPPAASGKATQKPGGRQRGGGLGGGGQNNGVGRGPIWPGRGWVWPNPDPKA